MPSTSNSATPRIAAMVFAGDDPPSLLGGPTLPIGAVTMRSGALVVVVACVVVVVVIFFFAFVDGGVVVATVDGAGVAAVTSRVLVGRRRVVGVVCGATVCGDTVAGGGDVCGGVAGGSVGCGWVGGGVVGASVGHGTVLPSPSTHVCACASGSDVSAIVPVAASA